MRIFLSSENVLQKYDTILPSKKHLYTLVCEINVPARINVPPGKFSKDNKRAPWKTWLKHKSEA